MIKLLYENLTISALWKKLLAVALEQRNKKPSICMESACRIFIRNKSAMLGMGRVLDLIVPLSLSTNSQNSVEINIFNVVLYNSAGSGTRLPENPTRPATILGYPQYPKPDPALLYNLFIQSYAILLHTWLLKHFMVCKLKITLF